MTQIINQDFIEQMPGGVLVLDVHSIFLAGNKQVLHWLGFESHEQLIGKTYGNMPCKASEQHDDFVNLDKKALEQPISVLGYNCYNKNDWRVLFAEKYPIKNDHGEVCGHITHAKDITDTPGIYNYAHLIADGAGSFFKKKQTIFLIEALPDTLLTSREFECLFFLLRGKAAREIAKLLGISIRTVEYYIIRIKEKFQCETRSQLIEYAIAKGYINIIPKSLMQG